MMNGTGPVTASIWRSWRLLVSVLSCLVTCFLFASQTSMTSAMVCMIEKEHKSNSTKSDNKTNYTDVSINNTYYSDVTGIPGEHGSKDQEWHVDWNSQTQGLIVASFFVGYYVMQIPSGVIVTRFGPKSSMVFGLLTTGVLHVLCVPAARWSLPLLYVIRALSGLACGCMIPGTYALVANWCPAQETSFLYGIASVGIDIGNSFSFFLALFACQIDFEGGWPIIFYALGSIQILMAITMMVCVTDFPSTHRFIDPSEAKYISDNRVHEKKATFIPVRRILRSSPVWAFIVAQLSVEYMYYTVFTQGPLYLRDVIKLPDWQTNMLGSLPFVITIPTVLVTSWISDRVVQKKMVTRTTVRKVNQSYATILMVVSILLLSYLPQGAFDFAIAIYLVWAIGIGGAYSGFLPNPGDLSPAHAGFVASLGQVLTMWVAFAIPIFTGHLTTQRDRHSWHTVFYIVIGLQVFACIFYLVFSSSELQPWALEEINEETPIVQKHDGNHHNKE